MPETKKIKVLYVDDEINNLIGFKASFRINYTVFTASKTDEASAILENNPDIRVIFCDQQMPEKTGVQFFEDIRTRFPHPMRILMTGYADIEAVIDAINRSHIFRYVKKPWIEADIISAIDEANKFYVNNSIILIKNQELEKAYIELDKFSYSVTHDIRAPLASILGAIEISGYIDDIHEIKGMLKMMEDSARNLDTYVQNIHDHYNIRRGELKIEEINFNELAKEQEDFFKLTSRLNNVRFTISILQKEAFRCDKVTLNIILNNLLANAFKYQNNENSNKFVEWDVCVSRGSVTICVRDNGIGIEEKYFVQIFKMFFRASSKQTGSGLGLYNVKDALLRINGEITVDSSVGKGALFTVVIPNR